MLFGCRTFKGTECRAVWRGTIGAGNLPPCQVWAVRAPRYRQPGVMTPMITSGYAQTMLILTERSAAGVGMGTDSLGTGTTTTDVRPVNISMLADIDYLSTSAHSCATHSLAVDRSGALRRGADQCLPLRLKREVVGHDERTAPVIA